MKTFFKCRMFANAVVAALTVLAASGVAYGQLPNQNWTGDGDGTTFLDPANWDTVDVIPGIFDETLEPINGVTINLINGDFTVDRSAETFVNFTQVNDGAVLNITDGIHNDALSNVNRRTAVGTSGAGTVNQSGGEFTVGHALRVGVGGETANGVYNLTGGTLLVTRSSNSIFGSAAPDGGRPTVEIGSAVDGSAGLLEISGDATFQTRTGLHLISGTFSVIGSDVTEIGIGSNQTADGLWLQFPDATLRVGLDSGGVTPILVDVVDGGGAGGGNVTFQEGAMLDPFNVGGATNALTLVMTWEGTLDNGPDNDNLELTSDAVGAGWIMTIDGNQLFVQNPNLPDPPEVELGDFNDDGLVDCADLDSFSGNLDDAAAEGSLAVLDLNGDTVVNQSDVDLHITTLVVTQPNGVRGTARGDFNCDGLVNVTVDAFILVANLLSDVDSYSEGDANLDGTVNVTADAFALVANLGFNNEDN